MDTALTNTPSALAAARARPFGRPAGLEDHRGPLRGGLPLGEPGHGEVLAVVVDVVDAGGVDVDPALAVADDGVVLPGVLPQLVADLEVLGGHVVALVVRGLLAGAEVAGGAVGVGGDQVPADAAAGEVVEAREAPGHCVRVLVGGRARDARSPGGGSRSPSPGRRGTGRSGGSGRRRRARRRPRPRRRRGSPRGRRRRCRRGRPPRAAWRTRSRSSGPCSGARGRARAARGRRTGGRGPEVEREQAHPVGHDHHLVSRWWCRWSGRRLSGRGGA